MILRDVAHVRSGDKGDISQISVIAFCPENYALLCAAVTVERVRQHFTAISIRAITRYELPALCALNFVLEGALPGGVTRSLGIDPHGKTLAMQLLTLEIGES